MDNVNKKSVLQKCTYFVKHTMLIFPILVDILGIVSLFTNSLQQWIDKNIGVGSCITIITILNIVLLGAIFIVLNDKAMQKSDKANQYIEGYDKILKRYSECFSDFENNIQVQSDVENLYETATKSLKEIVDKIRNIISEITDSNIRVCIKAFPKKYSNLNLDEMEIFTFCRSDNSLKESVMEHSDKVKVCENTDFKLIMMKSTSYPYFAFNGLLNFEKETGMKYENSTDEWDRKYIATIVYPISRHTETIRGREYFNTLGFLCIDTLDENAFAASDGRMCIKFLSSISHLLYIFLDKCIIYKEDIENKVIQKNNGDN